LKSTSRGFLRLAVDNTKSNTNRSLFSALAPFLAYSNTADQVEEFISARILPRQFLQLNGGNLVHEFFNKCDKPPQNSMREFVGRYVGVDQLTSANIPAIERLMNSYDCFKDYLEDESQRKDMRIFYQALSEPGVLMARGLLLIILEVTVERDVLKIGRNGREGRETEVKLANVRCPAYPLSEGQQKADVGFIVHYTEIRRQVSRARGVPDTVSYHNMGWEPLFYVEPTAVVGKTQRHKPTLTFKRADEASWPPIVQRRVSEFFSRCGSVTRGPFTSQSGMDPNALITATEVMTGVKFQTYGMIRDAYNHFVGITYGIAGKQGLVAVPVADDGSIHFERRLHFDWDDYTPAAADDILKWYVKNIRSTFGQYRGYDILRIVNARAAEGAPVAAAPRVELIKSKDTSEIIGVRLANGFVIPAANMREPDKILEFLNDPENIRLPDGVAGPIQIVTTPVDEFEWDLNRTIAYDADFRKKAFEDAEEPDTDAAKYPKKYLQLKHTDIKDELEDIYQHLRLSFARWLGSKEAGKSLREALKAVLRRNDLPLFEKRKRLDILLERKVTAWMEPTMAEGAKADVGFLRVDCMVPGMTQDECTGRCKWSTESNTCKIHTPANFAVNGEIAIPVPRMLYLRLVDELIRYASKREEIFTQSVPRLTIRQEAERKGDQYVIVEGTPDWNSWWEMLRSDWMTPEMESKKHFDEKYMPIPVGYGPADTRSLPESMRRILGAADPKTANLVWNPSLTPDMPYRFLLSVMKGEAVETEPDDEGHVGTGLKSSQIKRIAQVAKATVIYLTASDTDEPIRLIGKYPGATEALMIGRLNDVPGWVSMKGTFNVKLPLMAIPDAIRKYAI
jgi:hypothetical protein